MGGDNGQGNKGASARRLRPRSVPLQPQYKLTCSPTRAFCLTPISFSSSSRFVQSHHHRPIPPRRPLPFRLCSRQVPHAVVVVVLAARCFCFVLFVLAFKSNQEQRQTDPRLSRIGLSCIHPSCRSIKSNPKGSHSSHIKSPHHIKSKGTKRISLPPLPAPLL